VTRETLTGAEIPTLGRISTLPSIRGWILGDVSGSEVIYLHEAQGGGINWRYRETRDSKARLRGDSIEAGAYHGGRDAGVSDEKIAICRA
jgi:hypothetical protein